MASFNFDNAARALAKAYISEMKGAQNAPEYRHE